MLKLIYARARRLEWPLIGVFLFLGVCTVFGVIATYRARRYWEPKHEEIKVYLRDYLPTVPEKYTSYGQLKAIKKVDCERLYTAHYGGLMETFRGRGRPRTIAHCHVRVTFDLGDGTIALIMSRASDNSDAWYLHEFEVTQDHR